MISIKPSTLAHNTTSNEFDFYTLGGTGDANSDAVAIDSIPYGDIVVLGNRPSCSESDDCSLKFGSNILKGSKDNTHTLSHTIYILNIGDG